MTYPYRQQWKNLWMRYVFKNLMLILHESRNNSMCAWKHEAHVRACVRTCACAHARARTRAKSSPRHNIKFSFMRNIGNRSNIIHTIMCLYTRTRVRVRACVYARVCAQRKHIFYKENSLFTPTRVCTRATRARTRAHARACIHSLYTRVRLTACACVHLCAYETV